MARQDKPDRGYIEINEEACKGCGLCVVACPPDVLALTARLNSRGYHPVAYLGSGCTGCGICYYACPDPGALIVYTTDVRSAAAGAAPAQAAVLA